ncbi:MAG: LamG domain-containing protein, partial [Phaeodactylibacter sp.]|nr:LamG domain-containing protein [Phaeodactylibacter sp.]
DAPNNRTSGFRFFRENAGGEQRFKLNIGTGAGESWFDGGDAADVIPDTDDWHHFAFTISADYAAVYIDGQVVKDGAFDGVDWTGCDILSIMSGAPRFTGWSHLSDQSYMDELRIFNRALSQSEIQEIIVTESGGSIGYTPKYDGETFYLGFDNGEFQEMVSGQMMTVVGSPGFAGEGKVGGNAYAGATDSYLTFPLDGLAGNEFSAAFWMKINAMPDRAGILVVGPPDPDNPGAENVRTSGFRFFRENAGGLQRFKLNAGNGTADSWFDGGTNADVEPDTGEWDHFAFTISGSECVVYINGEVAAQGAFDGIDWTDCDMISIMSGAPHFTGWSHFSDLSYMDELRLFNKALTQEEVNQIIADEM